MFLLVSACVLGASIPAGILAMFSFGHFPDGLTVALATLCYSCLIVGGVATIFGLGMWAAHPHTWHF